MSDLAITTRKPQDTDTERLLLARLLAASSVKTTGTALASSARTATTQSSDIDTTGYRAALFFLNITAASGTGGLQFTLRGKDPVTGYYVWLGRSTVNTTTTTTLAFCAGLGVGGISGVVAGAGGNIGVPLPETIRIEVTHGDASSYTYSVGYCLA
jgi:hypothetical protein